MSEISGDTNKNGLLHLVGDNLKQEREIQGLSAHKWKLDTFSREDMFWTTLPTTVFIMVTPEDDASCGRHSKRA